ncbi:MAG: cytochrome c-type biogenesis protein CcmH/NrfF [Candidatus Aldehydirespiratoraceae bacterium]|jgi:cytochrome c-type biogenesis protein CcmH/NrfF
MTRRRVQWLVVAVVAVGAFLYGSIDEGAPRTNADRAYALATTIGCPVCTGQSAAESDASTAKVIRASIATWVDEGRSDEFIRNELRTAYGDDVDYTPSSDGITSLVWIIPVVAGAGALAALIMVFRRWGSEAGLEASADDQRLVAKAREGRGDD